MKSSDLPTSQAIATAVAGDMLKMAKGRGRGAALLPALAPGSPLEKSIADSFAPIRQALEALADRLDRLENR
jgi:hypothetical protein